MVVDSLKASGLKEFQISVGHASFFQGLVQSAGLGEEETQELRELLNNKNFFGVEEFIETLDLEENLKNLFGLLGSFETKEEEIVEAKKLAASYPVILSAITDLETLGEYLKLYGIEKYISFELGIISNYHICYLPPIRHTFQSISDRNNFQQHFYLLISPLLILSKTDTR